MATNSNIMKKDKDNTGDLAELEKRLLAGFASIIQREIEPLKKDIKEIKEEQSQSIPNLNLDNCEAITRKFTQRRKSIGSYRIGLVSWKTSYLKRM